MMPPWLSGLYDKHSIYGAQFLKFGVVGVANTLIDLCIFSLLFYGAGVALLAAHIAGFLAAVVNSYICNRLWTFRDAAGGRSWRQAVRFFAVAVSALVLSSLLMLLLSSFMPALAAKILVIGVTVFYSYCANRFLVFKG